MGLFSELEDIPLFGEWKILQSDSSNPLVLVDVPNREIKAPEALDSKSPTLLSIVSGTYSSFPFGKCFEEKEGIEVKFSITGTKGPKYWSNSCNIDSVLAVLAYSTGISWRGLMMLSEISGPSNRKLGILQELHALRGTCSITRNILRDLPFSKLQSKGVWKMRRAGEIYDLITDIFPELKMPIIDGGYTTFRSLIALEDFIDGSIKIEELENLSHLVFENNLVYEELDSPDQEEDKPRKINHLSFDLFDRTYDLCGIVFHEGVSPIRGPLENIHSGRALGSHYYSMVKLPDGQWYYYNDIEGGKFVREDLEGLASRNDDPGVLYFYQRVIPLKKEKIAVRSPVLMEVSMDFSNLVVEYSNLATTVEYVREGTPEEFIRVMFNDADNRVEFEKLLRS